LYWLSGVVLTYVLMEPKDACEGSEMMGQQNARHGQLRIAVVGLGMALKPHLLSLRDLSDRVEIAACYTPSSARRGAFGRENPELPVVDSLDRVFADSSIKAVMLLTPPTTHLELVERSAAAGKHVLLEPVEVSVERARACVDIMERSGRRFGVVLQHRFREASRKLTALVRSGELGALVSGSASIRWWRSPTYFAEPGRGMRARDGGGVLLTQAIHTLDLFGSLAGPIARVAAMTATSPLRRVDTEDIACAAILFGNGAVGAIDATTVSYPGSPERIELACENGTAVLAAESLEVFWKDGRHDRLAGSAEGGGGADPMAFSHEAHKALLADFIDALDQDRDPAVSGREALKVQMLIEAILRSSAEGRPVDVGAP
jgi:predicted dehydrogenase